MLEAAKSIFPWEKFVLFPPNKHVEEKCVNERTCYALAKKTKDDNDEEEEEEEVSMSAPARPKRRWFVIWLEAETLGVECFSL